MSSDRFARQRDLVPMDGIERTRATVVGVGAIGRQVAIQLAAIGVPRIQLIDFDLVESVNVTTQGYFTDDIGRRKVFATSEVIQELDSKITVIPVHEKFTDKIAFEQVMFCCVDSIDARRDIWRAAHKLVRFWSDGRMLGEVIRIITCVGDDEYYWSTLFASQEAQRGRCTARGTIYTANIAAGLMLEQFTRWLRNIPTDRDLSLNLLTSELEILRQ